MTDPKQPRRRAARAASPSDEESPETAPGDAVHIGDTSLAGRIGQELRDRRKALRLTLAQVSERSSLSISYLSAIEKGTNLPSLPSLVRLTDALQTDLPTLLVAEGASRVHAGRLPDDDSSVELSHPELQLSAIALRSSPGDEPELQLPTKDHDVLCYVVFGELRVTLDERRTILLSDGDALDVRSASSIHVSTQQPTLSIWTSCPVLG